MKIYISFNVSYAVGHTYIHSNYKSCPRRCDKGLSMLLKSLINLLQKQACSRNEHMTLTIFEVGVLVIALFASSTSIRLDNMICLKTIPLLTIKYQNFQFQRRFSCSQWCQHPFQMGQAGFKTISKSGKVIYKFKTVFKYGKLVYKEIKIILYYITKSTNYAFLESIGELHSPTGTHLKVKLQKGSESIFLLSYRETSI